MELLARETLAEGSVDMISKVFDQNLEFVSLEHRLFSLDRPGSYVQYNDPTCPDAQVYFGLESRAGVWVFCECPKTCTHVVFSRCMQCCNFVGAWLNPGRRPLEKQPRLANAICR